MPIYEYECTKCGDLTEVWQNLSDAPLTRCKACRGKVRKLISQSTFHLKGTGWYVTDYANKRSGSAGEKSEKASGTKETKGSGEAAQKKSDSKADSSVKKDS